MLSTWIQRNSASERKTQIVQIEKKYGFIGQGNGTPASDKQSTHGHILRVIRNMCACMLKNARECGRLGLTYN